MISPRKLIRHILGIDIVQVFSLNALSTFVRMLAGMISVKVVAVIIGPAGIALLGQLGNFSTIVLGMANGGISSGITKYVSEFKDDENKVKLYISNALKITLACSALIGLLLILFSRYLSLIILQDSQFYYVFIVFGVTIILFTLNNLLISILNGYKKFKQYVRVSIFGTIIGLIYSIVLVSLWGLHGAMINAVTFQSIMFFVTLWMCRKMTWMKRSFFVERYNSHVVRKYLGFSLMTITTLALVPVSQLLLRGYVISELSASDAGIWEGMNRISTVYLSVIISSFTIYYLPRLSEISNIRDLHNELIRCYKFIVPILLCICISLFIFKHFILWFLFTPDFYPMEDLFIWQLAGDMMKICSWILAYQMIAKAKTMMYISTEIGYTLIYLGSAYILFNLNGIVGLCQGYLISYLIYMLMMVYFFRNVLIIRKYE